MADPYVDLNTIHVPATGVPAPAGWGSQTRQNFEALAKPIKCRVRKTSSGVAPVSGVATKVIWTTQDYDDSPLGDLWVPGAPDQFVLPVAGVWECKFSCKFGVNGTGERFFWWQAGGSIQELQIMKADSTVQSGLLAVCENVYAAGTVMTAWVTQNCGAGLGLDVTWETWATLRLVSR